MKLSHSRVDDMPQTVDTVGTPHLSAGKVLYGLLFVLVLPALLILGAYRLDRSLSISVPHSLGWGIAVTAIGCMVMLAGTVALWKYGRGLPMSPYPPLQYVRRGIYYLLPHPIYVGYCLACGGISLAVGSPAGLWIVTPTVILACAAFVYGYEGPGLTSRFGANRAKPLLSLPPTGDESPTIADRISVYMLVLLPWLLAYEAVVFVGPLSRTINLTFSFEYRWPVVQWTELIYATTYLWVLATPLVARTRRQLREFAASGLLVTLAGTLLFFLLPVAHEFRLFEPSNFPGRLLQFEQLHDSSATAFPAFHLIWSLLAMRTWFRAWPKMRLLWAAWAAAIAISCITTGMHGLADLAGALAVTIIAWQRRAIWRIIRGATERLANSWVEWHIGPVRIINHSIYAGFAAALGLLLVSVLLPSTSVGSLFLIIASGVAGGALFAQWVEGSSRLLRPFGYFGAVLGCCVGVALVSAQPGVDGALLFAAFAVAAPFAQAGGRLRCLVQGCCHGRVAHSEIEGIRCWHPSSRVVHLAELANHPVYPTPLYSIIWNLTVGLILVRLWSLSAPATMVSGLYFILVGLGRFVEEAYRGEPQTPILAGLRLYQWWSIAFVVAGAVISMFPSEPTPSVLGWRWPLLFPILVGGLIWGAAMGVDFPKSTKRFARLSG